jgi:Bromodomain
MDLQTMGRKIKTKAYHSKKVFADDLNLIWDNCLTYNSDPVGLFHISFGTHAMERTANRFIPESSPAPCSTIHAQKG